MSDFRAEGQIQKSQERGGEERRNRIEAPINLINYQLLVWLRRTSRIVLYFAVLNMKLGQVGAMRNHVASDSVLITDEFSVYNSLPGYLLAKKRKFLCLFSGICLGSFLV